jgi:hypothetical protein
VFEYLFVEIAHKLMGGGYHVTSVNGEKIKGNPPAYYYANILGNEGWEYVGLLGMAGHAQLPCMIFKRRR